MKGNSSPTEPEFLLGNGKQSKKHPILGYALLLILSLIWGLAFVAIKRAVFELGPVTLTLARWLIASTAFLLLAPAIGRPKTKVERKDAPRLLLVSLASVGGYHLSLNYAETIVSSGLAGLLISFGPIFAVLLSSLFLEEKIGISLTLALAIAILGALTLALNNSNLTFLYLTGPVAVIFSAFMYGVFAVASKPLVTKYGALPTGIWAAVLGTAVIMPLVSHESLREMLQLSIYGWFSVLYLAIPSTVLANIILYTLINTKAVSTLSVQLYIIPVISVIGGILLLKEAVTSLTVLGGALLLGAVSLATSVKK